MRITFVGHASLLIEANGLTILSDPWWQGPCFGAQWWPYPLPDSEIVKSQRVDYVYISHGHHDHFHLPTLKLFPGAKVLVAKGSELVGALRDLDFEVMEVGSAPESELGDGVRCRIFKTHADDTLLAVSDGTETCINLNDALHAAPEIVQRKFCRLIRKLYGRPDYVFCGYGTASHFPNCYVIPGKDRARTAVRRQAYFTRIWAKIIRELNPRFGFPFAADVVFLENELFWCNEPVHNAERPTAVFERLFGRKTGTHVVDIAPGFSVAAGRIARNTVRQRFSADAVRETYGEAIGRVNRIASVGIETVRELKEMLERNIGRGAAFFASYDGSYRCLLHIKGASAGIEVVKAGRDVNVEVVEGAGDSTRGYDVVYRTRAPYLRQSLATRYGHEILFVGSGGIFEFPDRSVLGAGIHWELMTMLKPVDIGTLRRPVGSSGAMALVKRSVKQLLGMSGRDLYDVEKWTVYAASADR